MKRETGASQVLQANQDSQEEQDSLVPQGFLETLAPRVRVSPVVLEIGAHQDFQDLKDYWDLRGPRDQA